MCENETDFCDDREYETLYQGSGCAGFPYEGGGHKTHLRDANKRFSFGDDLELEFIDGVTESECGDTATESLLDSVINSLSRKEKQCLRKGKKWLLCVMSFILVQ